MQSSQFSKAIDMFLEMCSCGVWPNLVTMLSIIQVCIKSGDFKLGKCVHGCIVRLGMGNEVRTSLIDMHSNMGEMQSACWVFETMQTRNLVSWNVMISGCLTMVWCMILLSSSTD